MKKSSVDSNGFDDIGFVVQPLVDVLSHEKVRELRKRLSLVCEHRITPTRVLGELGTEVNQIFEKAFEYINCSEIMGHDVKLMPIFHVARNYHVSRTETPFAGWHRDAGGEYRYAGCRKLLNDPEYRFAKIGIYLQLNDTTAGGSIDVIPGSHRWGRLRYSLIANLFEFSRIGIKFFGKNRLVAFDHWVCKKMGVRSLSLKEMEIALFDSRLIHRGTPHQGLSTKDSIPLNFKAFESDATDKFVLYCHVGNSLGVDSYFLDRSRRPGNESEFKFWVEDYAFFKKLD